MRIPRLATGWLLGALAAGQAGAGAALDDLWRALAERHVRFDTQGVETAAIAAALRAVDPQAQLLAAGDAAGDAAGPTVLTQEELGEDLAYLKLGGLYATGGGDAVTVVAAWATQGLYGVVLDLRGAGGQGLDAADAVAGSLGLGEGATYAVTDGAGEVLERRRPHAAVRPWSGRPVLILVDGNTRGASEILAWRAKGQPGFMLLGTPTRGSIGLREPVPLADGRAAWVRTRWIVGGSASNVAAAVAPDVVAVAAGSATNAPRADRGGGGKVSAKAEADRKLMERVRGDGVLTRAVDILLGLKALESHGATTATNAPARAGS